ncbi:MAG: IS3 family transposase, partial [Xanthomonadaceae bacterium]|nr:IS3 family transposase [Xanthomonadaceae bacterium]
MLEVSVSGFHHYLHRQDRPDADAALRVELRRLHADSRGSYGRPRLVRALRARTHPIGHKRVARLMREEGLRGKTKGRFKPCIPKSRHSQLVAENRLD